MVQTGRAIGAKQVCDEASVIALVRRRSRALRYTASMPCAKPPSAHGTRPLVCAACVPRAQLIAEHGVARTFKPFDRVAMLGWEREEGAELLARLQATRSASLAALAAMDLTATDLARRGLHPDFGEVTLGQLLATWVAHDLTHVAQISEVLARHYRDAVGPWRVLLPALEKVADAE